MNQPEYFYRFVERAAEHALAYLGEAEFSRMVNEFGPKVVETLTRVAPDVVRREQYMDFLRNRSFRETLLVRKEVALNRKVSPLRLMSLSIASKARPVRDPGPADQCGRRVPDARRARPGHAESHHQGRGCSSGSTLASGDDI